MYQKILNGLQDFFGISRKEARGALVMMFFCSVVIWSPVVFRRWILPLVPAGSPPPERRVLDSIALLLEKQQLTKYKPGKRSNAPNEPDALKPEQIKLVLFDPNIASVRELMSVGIPAFLAGRIERFRSKGGRFRRGEDLMKIYDFPPELYARLEKYVVIRDRKPAVEPVQNSSATRPGNGRRQVTSNSIQPFDINRCDTTALIRLKGIGSKLALRILKFRDGLGGFHATGQFNEIYGLDSLALSELRHYARIGSAVNKININTATAEELGRHPYLRNRKQMQVLINYRTQHGPFGSLEELRNVKVLDETTIQKAGPYLSF